MRPKYKGGNATDNGNVHPWPRNPSPFAALGTVAGGVGIEPTGRSSYDDLPLTKATPENGNEIVRAIARDVYHLRYTSLRWNSQYG